MSNQRKACDYVFDVDRAKGVDPLRHISNHEPVDGVVECHAEHQVKECKVLSVSIYSEGGGYYCLNEENCRRGNHLNRQLFVLLEAFHDVFSGEY